MLVRLVERSLDFDHAPKSQVCPALHGEVRVLVNTADALIADIENEAQYHGRLSQDLSSLNHIFMVEFEGGGILAELERAIDVAEVVIFKLHESRNHICQILLILPRPRLILRRRVTLLLNDACRIIKRTTRDKALLARCTLNIQNQAVGRKLHAREQAQDAAGLDVGLPDRHEAAELSRDHKVLVGFVVYLIRYLSLSELEGDIPQAHQRYIYEQGNYRKVEIDLVVHFGVVNHH